MDNRSKDEKSESNEQSAADDRFPSQAEGDLETVEEDLREKAKQPEELPEKK